MDVNVLYYGDNLEILRKYIQDNSIDLIYLDPPFNSKATYNILFKEQTGKPSDAQITAFEDTWHWTSETEKDYQEIIDNAPSDVVEMMIAFRKFIKRNDMMAYLTRMCIRLLELKRVLKTNGSIYLHCDPTAGHYLKTLMDTIFGVENFQNEIIWSYRRWTAISERYQRMHDNIYFYKKSNKAVFNAPLVPYADDEAHFTEKDEKGEYRWQYLEGKKYKLYKKEGVRMGDVWEIPIINSMAKERLGYPTQKPEALLERIINASSKEDDIVLDPFCGCGTTISVAQKFNRKWIGIDITHLAINLIKWRMKNMFQLEPKKDYKIIGEPEDLSGARELAKQNRYQFQWWALSLIGARPYGDKKKGADTGIDGYYYFNDGKETHKSIVQVKSGNVGVSNIRDFIHVLNREKSSMGFFITLEEATKPMYEEAIKEGFYTDVLHNKYQKVQILTIEELLNGKKPDTPQKIPITEQLKKNSKQIFL